jgi:hypothetical protein
VHPEADQTHHQQRQQAQEGGPRRLPTLPPPRGGEDQKRQQQARRQLHPHTRRQGTRARAKPRVGLRRQGQGPGHRQQHQGVVVGPSHRQHQQHRVEPHEGRRPPRGATQPTGRPRDQGDGGEAREDGDHLEGPQPPSQAERHDRIAEQREEGAVGGVQEGPPDEPVGGVPEGFRRHMGIGVESVQGAHAGKGLIAKDILGDQRRTQRQHHMGPHDRERHGARRQGAGTGQDEQVAARHHQDQSLERGTGEGHVQPRQRPREPPRPAPHPGRDILRGTPSGPRADHQGAHQDPQQPHRPHRPQRPHRPFPLPGPTGTTPNCALGAPMGYGSRDLDAFHCYVWETCKSPPRPVP